jgi:hypothetical protein
VTVIPLLAAMLCSKKTRLLGGTALVFSLSALYFTFSRAAYLGLFAALFVFLLAAARKMKWKKMFWAALVVPVLLAVIVAAVNLNPQNGLVKGNPLLERLVLSGENLRSAQTRLVLWPATISQILHSPLVGYGLDTYAITFPAYAPAELNTLENMGDYPDRAHNVILDYALQFGLPGLLVFAFFVLTVFAKGFRFVFAGKKDWIYPLAIMASVSGILTANLFGFFITVTWVYFWLLLAILLNLVVPKKEYDTAFLGRKYAGPFLIGAVFCAGLAGVVTQDFSLFWADVNYRDAALMGNQEAAAIASKSAPQISFFSLQQSNLELAAAYMAESEAEKQKMLESAAAPLDHAGRLTGFDGFYNLYKGIIGAAQERQASSQAVPADKYFTLAAQKMPVYPAVRLEYGKALLKSGRYTQAAAQLEQYLALSPPYYLWKGDLGSRTPEEQERFRIFYKLNPDFDSVFSLLTEATTQAGDLHQAALYGGYLYY